MTRKTGYDSILDATAKLDNSWRGGRVVEGDGLENHYTRKGIAGSNPVLSASTNSTPPTIWRGARAADWDRLLSGCTFTGTAGSNPVLSEVGTHQQFPKDC